MHFIAFFLVIIPLPHHHLLRLVMTKIDDAEVAVDGDRIAHLQWMAVELAELVVDVYNKGVIYMGTSSVSLSFFKSFV